MNSDTDTVVLCGIPTNDTIEEPTVPHHSVETTNFIADIN